MTEEPKSSQGPALAAMRIASLWLLAGALFKLFKGSPADLPPNLVELVGRSQITLFFKAAIAIELAVVVLVWLKPKFGWFFLAGNFAVFIAVLFPLALEGAESCGCFGGSITISPWLMIGIDGTLLLAILATRPWSTVTSKGGPWILTLLLIGLGAAAPWIVIDTEGDTTPAPVTNGETSGPGTPEAAPRFVVFDFPTWVGKSIYDEDLPLRKHLDANIEELAPDGRWIFWRMTCSHCAAHLLELHANYDGSPLVLIRDHEPKDATEQPEVTLMPEGPDVRQISLRKGPVYYMTTPVEMIVSGGQILSVEENVGSEEH